MPGDVKKASRRFLAFAPYPEKASLESHLNRLDIFMAQTASSHLCDHFNRFSACDAERVTELVEAVLDLARRVAASDIHLQPTREGLQLRYRIDGLLQEAALFNREIAPNVVARLKVLARLLTYQTDMPQEGRIPTRDGVEMRLSTFPTLYGEKAVIRLFPSDTRFRTVAELGFPEEVERTVSRLLSETSGVILVCGPAGSGKTTTAYACLRELAAATENGPRSLVSLEDPIETAVDGVAQSQVSADRGFNMAEGLRFLMRQDPEVILVGEIRDQETAETAFRASLTGHLILTTFHAGSAAEAISRLSDMGVEPYMLRSGVLAILAQRLVRRLCDCAQWTDDPDAILGLPVDRARVSNGCDACHGSGYQGRAVLVEMLTPKRTEVARAILSKSDSSAIEAQAVQAGMQTRFDRALQALRQGVTSPREIRRVFGDGFGIPRGGFQ